MRLKQESLERAGWTLLLLHLMVSLFGLVGIAIMVPNPDLWSGWSVTASLFPLAVQQGGNLQILLGAAAVLVFGGATLGWRATMIFFSVSVALSMMLEFTGTSYGWPFGNYEYTDMFGPKMLGKVPPAIPLSWFFMGMASFGLASAIIRKWRGSAGLWPSILLGSLLLMTWDFVLDPAMSHETLALRYWVWEDTGPYMGIPLVNFVGWLGTGVVFMFAASYFDERLRPIHVERNAFFLLVYMCNLIFAVGICMGNQLWLPAILGSAFAGLILFAWFRPGFWLPALSEGV
jgi:putative membrane protein